MNIIEAFNFDFNHNLSSYLCKQVLTATAAFHILLKENSDFFSYPEFSSVKGTLLNYSIERSLYDAAFSADASYKAYQQKVNNFNRSILHLETEHFRVTAAKTMKWNTLPYASNYKRNYAATNSGCSGQLSFDFVTQSVSQEPYYAILTYGYNSLAQECNHIDLLLPDENFANFIYRKDLLSLQTSVSAVPSASEVEETLAKLKPEFEAQIVNLKAN